MSSLKIDQLRSSLVPNEVSDESVYLLSMTTREGTELIGVFKTENALQSKIVSLFSENLYINDGTIYPIFKYTLEQIQN